MVFVVTTPDKGHGHGEGRSEGVSNGIPHGDNVAAKGCRRLEVDNHAGLGDKCVAT